MTFDIALSGLAASRVDLDVTGNNIANAATSGFKGSRAEFADVFANSAAGLAENQPGNGVRVASVRQQFAQGNIESTSNTLDLAINGEGFFTLSDGETLRYTRDGAFALDRDGFVVNSRGDRLQAYPPLGDEFNTGAPGDLRLDTGVGAPSASTRVDAALNFSAQAPVRGGSAADIDPSAPDSFDYTTALTVYDSLGAAHTATVFARRTADLTYATRIYVDGTDMGAQDLSFDDQGRLQTPQPVALPNSFTPVGGGSPLTLSYDFTGSTLLGSEFSVTDLAQDGYTTGRLAGLAISDEGVISARYTNGRTTALGQIALTRFENPGGLDQLGDNAWAESFESGAAQLGGAGSGNLGSITSGGLEASNVDLSAQLVRLITAQRNFQANSQVISTADQVTQTAINIGR